jgi:FMN phosphatase YigB (HAD superfamily)
VTAAPVRAITFDYWNTIVRANGDQAAHRLAAWQELYAAAGHEVDGEAVQRAFWAVWDLHQAAWGRNEQYTGLHAADAAIDLIGISVAAALRADLVDAFVTAGERAGFDLCDGVDVVLPALRERGIALGIVCDVGFTPSTGLRRLLEGFGLLEHFSGWSFSDEVGWYKPAPEIFEHALGYLGVAPEAAAHIGDLRRTDVAGAHRMGMTAVRYRGANDDLGDGPEAEHVLDHHAELWGALAL